jgi:O-antigen ligase
MSIAARGIQSLTWRADVHQAPPRASQVAYLLFLFVTLNVILRPSELLSVVEGLSIYETLVIGTLLCTLSLVRDQVLARTMYVRPMSACTIGILVAVPISHLSHAWPSAAIESTMLFVKTVMYFMIMMAVIDSPQRLWWFIISIVTFSWVTVGLCSLDFVEWINLPFIEHFVQYNELMMEEMAEGELDPAAVWAVTRMCGTGIFHDPNDLALLISSVSLLVLYCLTDKRQGWLRFAWLIPLCILGIGLIFTRSRGGLLAGVVGGMTLVLLRYGGKQTVTIAMLGVLALPFAAGRQTEIDLEEGTGQERIQMWAEGLAELKSPNILFGIGQGTYGDIAGLVAHNSYVHAYVELGMFGGTFFFGLFYFAVLGLYRIYLVRNELQDPELRRLCPFVIAMVAAWGMGLFGLSRCYVVPTYMILGVAACFIHLAEQRLRRPRFVTLWDSHHVVRLVGASAATLAFFFVFVRVFARFG